MQPVNTAADFNKLAAEARGSTLLRIMLDGQGIACACREPADFCIETYSVFMSKEKLS